MTRPVARALLVLAAAALAACGEAKSPRPVRLATTTSVRDSKLLDALLPAFQSETGIRVDVIAVGTGAALQTARDGNADLLLVHDPDAELKFLSEGHGRDRREFMWNTFEVVGPPADPAGVKGAKDGAEALARIAKAGAGFVSRGDSSGTHSREKKLWGAAGGKPGWPGYVETGQGMGATLRVADERQAYTLTDDGTRLSYKGTLSLVPFVSGTPDLQNVYSVVRLDARRHADAALAEADRLADWIVSPATANRIAEFAPTGTQLFHPISGGD